MNQILKERVYTQGNDKWVSYVELLTEMNAMEREVFEGLHENLTDETIMANMGMSLKTFKMVEESVGKKLTWAVLYCIDFTMRNDK